MCLILNTSTIRECVRKIVYMRKNEQKSKRMGVCRHVYYTIHTMRNVCGDTVFFLCNINSKRAYKLPTTPPRRIAETNLCVAILVAAAVNVFVCACVFAFFRAYVRVVFFSRDKTHRSSTCVASRCFV